MFQLTKRAAMSISRLVDNPQQSVPIPAKKTAVWFAPRRPMTLERRPYRGVKVHIARRYLETRQAYEKLWEVTRRTKFPASLLGSIDDTQKRSMTPLPGSQ